MDRSRDELAAFRSCGRPRNSAVRGSGLHVAALSHLREMQPTAESLQRAAERCVRERRRFPHTLIIGPRDSSKRTLARAIAWEMAVPVVEVDVKSMSDLHAVDAKVVDAGPNAVILLSGSDDFVAAAWVAERLAAGRRLWDESDYEGPWMQPWERTQVHREALPPITVILTCEQANRNGFGHGTSLGWVERTVLTERNAGTEAWRFCRLLRRAGIKFDADAAIAIGERVVNERVRTLAVAEQLQELLNSQGNPALTKEVAQRALDEVIPIAALPKGSLHHSSIGGTPTPTDGSADADGMSWEERERRRKKEEFRRDAIMMSILGTVFLLTCAVGTFAGGLGERWAADRILGAEAAPAATAPREQEPTAQASPSGVPTLLARDDHGPER